MNEEKNVTNTETPQATGNNVVANASQGINGFIEKLKSDKNLLIGTIVGAVVALIIVIALIMAVAGGSGPKAIAKAYGQAMVKYDAKKIAKLYHKDYLEWFEDNMKDDMKTYLKHQFSEWKDDDKKIKSFEIIDSEKYDKDDVEDYAERIEKTFDIDEKYVKAVYEFTIKFKVDDDGDKDTQKEEIHVVKIKNKWYLF